jgi:ATP-dependent RNA helicase DHX57
LPREAASATSSRIISVNMNADDPTVVKAAICAGLYPNLLRVMVPHKTYVATASGSVLADTTAQQLKFYVKSASSKPTAAEEAVSRVRLHNGVCENRVFLHPSSFNFNEGTYPSPWLVYNEIVQTSKLFVRDCTNVSNYALLLFGGGHAATGGDDKRASTIRVQHADGTITVGGDDWVRFRAPAKIGVLVKHLRKALDCLFAAKIDDASLDISQSPVVDAVVRLLTGAGM